MDSKYEVWWSWGHLQKRGQVCTWVTGWGVATGLDGGSEGKQGVMNRTTL